MQNRCVEIASLVPGRQGARGHNPRLFRVILRHPTCLRSWFLCTLCIGSMAAALGSARLREPTAERADWPRWRGSNYDGKSAAAGIFRPQGSELRVAWKVQLGTGYSAVSVAQGRAVTLFSDDGADWVGALDANTGRELWRFRIDDYYAGQDGARDGPTATPLIDAGQVFAVGPRGRLLCLDLLTGSLAWSVDLVRDLKAEVPHWGFTTSPLVYKNLLIVSGGGRDGKAITAFDRKTGSLVWAVGNDTVQYQSPILARLAGIEHVVYAGSERISGLDPASGTLLWEFRHAAAGFYSRIINPVVVDGDKIFLLLDRTDSVLLRISQGNGGLQAEAVWKGRDLKGAYNVPIHHKGFIYGYSGHFLACVDAAGGQLKWKSRPPGRGFMSLVDDRLVVMTEKGALHIVSASPDGYREEASLDLFGKESWTPPSIARGRIFARSSFGEVAAVDVVASDSRAPSPVEAALTIPESSFGRFVSRLTQADDKESLLDEFMSAQHSFPILEGKRWVHLVYRGPAKQLALGGDMFEARVTRPMNHVPGTDFWYASLNLEPESMISYFFERDLDERVIDPLNPHSMASPLVYGGVTSQLYMGSRVAEEIDAKAEGASGHLEEKTYPTAAGNGREVVVYLPRGYESGTRRYPVLYVHYGNHSLSVGGMDKVLDHLMAARRMRPLIAVFVPAATAYEFARSQREGYARFLVEELIPDIDSRYRTVADAAHRAVLGGDEGGFGAFYAAFKFPGTFGMVAAHSPIKVGYGDKDLWGLMEAAGEYRIEAYVDWGRYDFRNPATEEIAEVFGKELSRRLIDAGHQVHSGEFLDGAGFAAWRGRTPRLLELLFPAGSAAADKH